MSMSASAVEEASATKIQDAMRKMKASKDVADSDSITPRDRTVQKAFIHSVSKAVSTTMTTPLKVTGAVAGTAGSAAVDVTMHTASLISGTAKGATKGAASVVGIRMSGRGAHDARDADNVDDPTPEDRWFEPHIGWPCTDDNGGSPYLWMPTAKTEETLFPDAAKEAIGELRVEVLEAEGLPNNDAIAGVSYGNKTDSYALVLFEGSIGRTSIVRDSLEPRWSANDPACFRAFKFPVVKPYSVLYVSINDYDGGRRLEMSGEAEQLAAQAGGVEVEGSKRMNVNGDDPIGRVAIQLCRLLPGHEYDCWYPLALGDLDKPDGKLGYVRLRYSVTFKSERKRILQYANGSPPTFFLPLYKPSYRTQAQFAKRGLLATDEYNWDVLMAYVDELRDAVQLLVQLFATLESIFLWRLPVVAYSASHFVLFQFLVSYPNFIPASWVLGVVVLLLATYRVPDRDERLNAPVHQRQSLLELFWAIALNKGPTMLSAGVPDSSTMSCDAALDATERNTSDKRDPDHNPDQLSKEKLANGFSYANIGSHLIEQAMEYWEERILGINSSGKSKKETFQYHRKVCALAD